MSNLGARSFFLFLASLVFVSTAPGCTDSSMPNVYEARGFDQSEINELQSAADEWCARTGLAHCAVVVDKSPGFDSSTVTLSETMDTDHTMGGIVVSKEHSDALGNCLATVDHAGVRSTASCRENPDAESFAIQIRDSRDGDGGVNWFHGQKTTWATRMRTIFLHELGHTFGHSHTTKDGTVMNAVTTYQVEHLTEDDLAN